MALVLGTNCGFVTARPSGNPGGSAYTMSARARALKVTAPADATKVTEIGWWVDSTDSSSDTDVGIYDHDAGNNRPGNLLGKATFSKDELFDAVWIYNSVNIDISGNTIYWIAVECDNDGSHYTDYSTDATQKVDYKLSMTELPASWGSSNSSIGRLITFYAVYETEAAPQPAIHVINPRGKYWGAP